MVRKLEQAVSQMSQAVHEFPWNNRRAYADYLAQTYYFVSHSTRILTSAACHMPMEDNEIHNRFLAHSEEEKNHELLALGDMKKLGFTIQDFSELPETRMFYEPQFYKTEYQDPVSLMGWILVLESLAVRDCPWVLEQVTQEHGNKGHSFMKVHGSEDQDHVEKAIQQVKKLADHRLKLIEENIEQSACAYIHMLKAIEERSSQEVTSTSHVAKKAQVALTANAMY